MLAELQSYIANIYDTDCGHQLHDYLITDRGLANKLGRKALPGNIEEIVFFAEDKDGIALSVFLDETLLARLDNGDPINRLRADELGDLAVVLEGISHFNYLGWCAGKDKSVTLFELELQCAVARVLSAATIGKNELHPHARLGTLS